MKCFMCKSEMQEDTTIYTAELENKCIVVIKNVPCMKCQNCGEIWYNTTIAQQLEDILASIKDTVTEIAVVNFKVVA